MQVKFAIGNRPPNVCRVMAFFDLFFVVVLILISLEVCRRIYHCQIQVQFNIGNHPQNFSRYGPFWAEFGPFST